MNYDEHKLMSLDFVILKVMEDKKGRALWEIQDLLYKKCGLEWPRITVFMAIDRLKLNDCLERSLGDPVYFITPDGKNLVASTTKILEKLTRK